MPWAILLRILARVVAAMFVWRLATNRRGRRAPATAAPRAVHPGRGVLLREHAALSWRAVSLFVFGLAAIVLITAGTTITVLTPRWLGIALLVLAAVALVAAASDARALFRLLAERRRRRHEQELRGQVS